MALIGLADGWARAAAADPAPLARMRAQLGELRVWGLSVEVSQPEAAPGCPPDEGCTAGETRLTLHLRWELHLSDSRTPDEAKGAADGIHAGAQPDADRQLSGHAPSPGVGGRKVVVWVPVHVTEQAVVEPESPSRLLSRRVNVEVGPGRLAWSRVRAHPSAGRQAEWSLGVWVHPPSVRGPGEIRLAGAVAVSVVRDPVLLGAVAELVGVGGPWERADLRLAGLWTQFVNPDVALGTSLQLSVGPGPPRLAGRLRWNVTASAGPDVVWEVAVSHGLGPSGHFAVEVGVIVTRPR